MIDIITKAWVAMINRASCARVENRFGIRDKLSLGEASKAYYCYSLMLSVVIYSHCLYFLKWPNLISKHVRTTEFKTKINSRIINCVTFFSRWYNWGTLVLWRWLKSEIKKKYFVVSEPSQPKRLFVHFQLSILI